MNVPETRPYVGSRTKILAAASLLCLWHGTYGQTLNEAVNAQLSADVNLIPCAQLLSGDAASVLGSTGLFSICTRTVGQAGVPSASVGGGFAATPVMPPQVVEERIEREEDGASPARRGFFFSIANDSVNRVVSLFEDGYDSDKLSIAAGFDFSVGDSWVLGFAVDGSRQDGDFVDGGDFEIQALGITGFGGLVFGETGALDFYGGYSQLSNDRVRRATFVEIEDMTVTFDRRGTPVADYDASQLIAGLALSYDWVFSNVTLGPRIGYSYQSTEYDTYSENDDSGLALTFHDDDETSSQFYGGLAGSAAISTGFGAVLIEQSVLYRYESDQDQRDVQVSFVEDSRAQRFTYQTERPDRDYLEIGVGATFILQNGLQLGLGYRGIASHRFLSSNGVEFNFRKEF